MISILIPTRGRPDNVRRVTNSIFSTAANPVEVEVLFYVDADDGSFPLELINSNVRVVNGPRLELGILQNILYANCKGDLIMYAGDDVVFHTNNWDSLVLSAFNRENDKLILAYPNCLATHAGKMAIHGFLHRNWVETVGYWVRPGRGAAYDLWHTDVARKLGRLVYLEEVHVEHVHYRQGSAQAARDATYEYVAETIRSFNPIKTYKLMKRERRIDVVLLSEKIDTWPFDLEYAIGDFLAKKKEVLGIKNMDSRRLRTITNFEIFPLILINLIRVVTKQRRFK